jgi:hypothetical protein
LFQLVLVSTSFLPTVTPENTLSPTAVGTLPVPTSTPNPLSTPTDTHNTWFVQIQGIPDTDNVVNQYFVVPALATPTPTLDPLDPSGCGYSAWAGGVSAPLTFGLNAGGTTYIYTTQSSTGSQNYTVNIPTSGAYTMTASVSAPNGNSNTWFVEIQGASDTNNN